MSIKKSKIWLIHEGSCMLSETFKAYFRERINKVPQSIVCWGSDKGGIKEDSRVLPQMSLWIMKTVIKIGVIGG